MQTNLHCNYKHQITKPYNYTGFMICTRFSYEEHCDGIKWTCITGYSKQHMYLYTRINMSRSVSLHRDSFLTIAKTDVYNIYKNRKAPSVNARILYFIISVLIRYCALVQYSDPYRKGTMPVGWCWRQAGINYTHVVVYAVTRNIIFLYLVCILHTEAPRSSYALQRLPW